MDALASEYGQSPREVRTWPMAEIFCYHAAILQRHEVDTKTTTFTERDLLKTF